MRLKTLGALAVLGLCAVPALAVVTVAVLTRPLRPRRAPQPSGRTVLLTGGKMTKSLQLARMFAALGDRVIVAETPDYRYCGTRFSRAVDAFEVIPKFTETDSSAYTEALRQICEREGVDLFVPVASPAAALPDARAKPRLPPGTEAFHFDEATIKILDDKFAFCQLCRAFELSAPEVHRIEDPQQLLDFDFSGAKRYVLKSIAYDPVFRLDLRTLPHPGWRERVSRLPIRPDHPWVLQEFVVGREVCVHTTIRHGEVKLYICSDSSPFQVNYAMLELPEVYAWVRHFAERMGGTGQASFDFIVRPDGTVMPIECNPRTHSAITLFHDQPTGAAAYWPAEHTDVREWRPLPEAKPTYWLYHELLRIVAAKDRATVRALVRRIVDGKEAVFRWDDPLPFFFLNHVQIPALLLANLARDGKWEKIDFNIGKIVEAGGD